MLRCWLSVNGAPTAQKRLRCYCWSPIEKRQGRKTRRCRFSNSAPNNTPPGDPPSHHRPPPNLKLRKDTPMDLTRRSYPRPAQRASAVAASVGLARLELLVPLGREPTELEIATHVAGSGALRFIAGLHEAPVTAADVLALRLALGAQGNVQ